MDQYYRIILLNVLCMLLCQNKFVKTLEADIDEEEFLVRNKKDVSTITNFASPLIDGINFKKLQFADLDSNIKNYFGSQEGRGGMWRYQGSYMGTNGGYIYNRPVTVDVPGTATNGRFPPADDTVVIYPAAAGVGDDTTGRIVYRHHYKSSEVDRSPLSNQLSRPVSFDLPVSYLPSGPSAEYHPPPHQLPTVRQPIFVNQQVTAPADLQPTPIVIKQPLLETTPSAFPSTLAIGPYNTQPPLVTSKQHSIPSLSRFYGPTPLLSYRDNVHNLQDSTSSLVGYTYDKPVIPFS